MLKPMKWRLAPWANRVLKTELTKREKRQHPILIRASVVNARTATIVPLKLQAKKLALNGHGVAPELKPGVECSQRTRKPRPYIDKELEAKPHSAWLNENLVYIDFGEEQKTGQLCPFF